MLEETDQTKILCRCGTKSEKESFENDVNIAEFVEIIAQLEKLVYLFLR